MALVDGIAGASGGGAVAVRASSNGGAHHYDLASAWMEGADAASEELHR